MKREIELPEPITVLNAVRETVLIPSGRRDEHGNTLLEEDAPYDMARYVDQFVFSSKDWTKRARRRMADELYGKLVDAQKNGRTLRVSEEQWEAVTSELSSDEFEVPWPHGRQLLPFEDAWLGAKRVADDE